MTPRAPRAWRIWRKVALQSCLVFSLSIGFLAFSVDLPAPHAAVAGGNGNGNGNGGGNGNGNGHNKDKENNGNGNGNSNAGGNGAGNGKAKGKAETPEVADPSASPQSGPQSTGTAADVADLDGHEPALNHELVVTNGDGSLPAYAAARGFRIVSTRSLPNLGLTVTRLAIPGGVSVTTARQDLIARFPDAVVDYNHVYRHQAGLSIPPANYAAREIGWSAALRACSGPGLRVGLLDTAIDHTATILADARITQSSAAIDPEAQRADATHGTGIAALLVGQQEFGLLPAAELYAADIFTADQDGNPVATATAFAAGLDWLVENRVRTINVSLSGPPDKLMELAIRHAGAAGVRLVAAVGNDAAVDRPRFPAAYPGVIGVTAIDDQRRRFGPANQGDFVQLAAPGVDIWLPIEGNAASRATAEPMPSVTLASIAGAPQDAGTFVSGTSFAAPFVTAVLAASGNDPARLIADALDLGPKGRDPMFGFGLVRAPAACAPQSN